MAKKVGKKPPVTIFSQQISCSNKNRLKLQLLCVSTCHRLNCEAKKIKIKNNKAPLQALDSNWISRRAEWNWHKRAGDLWKQPHFSPHLLASGIFERNLALTQAFHDYTARFDFALCLQVYPTLVICQGQWPPQYLFICNTTEKGVSNPRVAQYCHPQSLPVIIG